MDSDFRGDSEHHTADNQGTPTGLERCKKSILSIVPQRGPDHIPCVTRCTVIVGTRIIACWAVNFLGFSRVDGTLLHIVNATVFSHVR